MAMTKKVPEAPEVKSAEVEQTAPKAEHKDPSKMAWLNVVGAQVHETAKEGRVAINVGLKNPETGDKSKVTMFRNADNLTEPAQIKEFNAKTESPKAKRYSLPMVKDKEYDVSVRKEDGTFETRQMKGADIVAQNEGYRKDLIAERQAAREAKAAEKTAEASAKVDRGTEAAARLGVEAETAAPEMQAGE